MVILSYACWLALVLVAQAPAPAAPQPDETSKAIRSALGRENFPWYDEKTDSTRPIAPPRERSSNKGSTRGRDPGRNGAFGNLVTMIGFGIGLALLVALLVWFWKTYEPSDLEKLPKNPRKIATTSKIESLPDGMDGQIDSSDPWEEAVRRRNEGDLSGAIVCLFAHQLLTLSRLGLVRLTPGRTGRQLLKAVTDSELRGMVQPTLRLFEIAFYGRRSPSSDEFERVWAAAEAFERRIAEGVAQ